MRFSILASTGFVIVGSFTWSKLRNNDLLDAGSMPDIDNHHTHNESRFAVLNRKAGTFMARNTQVSREVDYVGNPCTVAFTDGLCLECTGDCDKDSDCAGDLRCAQRSTRSGLENVPGCDWNTGSDVIRNDNDDFCFLPMVEPGVVNYVGECSNSGYRCGECEGDCDSDTDCADGLVCMSRSGHEAVPGCTEEGGDRDVWGKDICHQPEITVFIDSLTIVDDGCSSTSPCPKCSGSCSSDSDCDAGLHCFSRVGSSPVPGCVTGGLGDISDVNYCHKRPPAGNPTYVPGDLTVRENGLELSTGLSSRVIATTGSLVSYANGGFSSIPFHDDPDGAAVFSVNQGPNTGGWIYASNSEASPGGVGAITFDSNGDIINYKMIVAGTQRNCGGGKTYWNTWVTCEEKDPSGQVHEVDPHVGQSSQQETVLGGAGGGYESFAYDARDRLDPTFYVTNDVSDGGLVKFIPDPFIVAEAESSGDYSKVLTTMGTLEWLVLEPLTGSDLDESGTFRWTTSRSEADNNANLYYRNSEGIDIRNGFLYMTTKRSKSLFILDLDSLTYQRSSTRKGAFEGQPDQVARIIAEDPLRDMLYFCEEASGINNGVHARDSDGNFYTVINGPGINAETTGLSFSPDNRRMYVSYQGAGLIFEITRNDGYGFGAHRLDIKYHAN